MANERKTDFFINSLLQIDFAFMSSFMKDVEYRMLNTTLKVFKERLGIYELDGAINA